MCVTGIPNSKTVHISYFQIRPGNGKPSKHNILKCTQWIETPPHRWRFEAMDWTGSVKSRYVAAFQRLKPLQMYKTRRKCKWILLHADKIVFINMNLSGLSSQTKVYLLKLHLSHGYLQILPAGWISGLSAEQNCFHHQPHQKIRSSCSNLVGIFKLSLALNTGRRGDWVIETQEGWLCANQIKSYFIASNCITLHCFAFDKFWGTKCKASGRSVIAPILSSHIALHSKTLHCSALHLITFDCIALNKRRWFEQLNARCANLIKLYWIALHCFTFQFIALHLITFHWIEYIGGFEWSNARRVIDAPISLNCIKLHCAVLHFIALHYI